MADDVSDLRFFTHLVAAGSLSAAGRTLDASPAAMSRRLGALEKRLGVGLVARTTRKFELTAEGSLFHERCQRIVTEIDAAEAEASSGNMIPRGPLRIGVPLEIGRRRFAPIVADFVGIYPQVEAHLVLSDAVMHVAEDRLDVSLSIGMPAEQGVVATKVLSSQLVICATPAYLIAHGTPRIPADVLNHNCLRFVRGHLMLDVWSFMIDGAPVDVRIGGNLSTTSAEVVHDWVLAGRGLARKPLWDVESDLDAGLLVSCLDDYRHGEIVLYAVYLGRKHLPPRIRLFIDFVRERLR